MSLLSLSFLSACNQETSKGSWPAPFFRLFTQSHGGASLHTLNVDKTTFAFLKSGYWIFFFQEARQHLT